MSPTVSMVQAAVRRVIAVIAVTAVLAGVGGALAYRNAYGTFAWWSDPARISWCGRVYLRGDGTIFTRSAIEQQRAALPTDEPYAVTTVATIQPFGDPVLAAVVSEAARQSLNIPCAMVVYLETGPDEYRPYVLSGGP
jgi:hypothetical protein